MGYHVTILRTEAGRQQPITEDEVRRAIVPMAGRFEVFSGTKQFWLHQPALGDDSEILVLSDGELWAKTPGEPFVALMIELAGYLGARVRGDEWETYRSVDDTYLHPDDEVERDLAHTRRDGQAESGLVHSPGPRREARWRIVVDGALIVAGIVALSLYRQFAPRGWTRPRAARGAPWRLAAYGALIVAAIAAVSLYRHFR